MPDPTPPAPASLSGPTSAPASGSGLAPPSGRIIDLSEPIHSGMPVSARERPVCVRARAKHGVCGFTASELLMGTHAGTHLDAPFHFHPGGQRIDEIPLDRLLGEGLVLDMRSATGAIGPEEIDQALAREGGARPGDFIIVWTGWDTRLGTADAPRHPFLSETAAKTLLVAGASLVGIDATGVDDSTARDFPAHRLLLGAGVLLVENLRGLDRLGAGRAFFAFLPLLIAGAEAAPVRAVAFRGRARERPSAEGTVSTEALTSE